MRRVLEREVAGRQVTGVAFHDFPGVVGELAPEVFAARVTAQRIGEPRRRGKYLTVPLDGGEALLVHLRMTGRLLVVPSDSTPVRFEHLAIRLDDGRDLRFADQRKFGRVLVMREEEVDVVLAALGPEPLGRDFTASYLLGRLRNRTAPVKNLLLDQRIVAGLGNIYVDEALFRARVNPFTPGGLLDQGDWRRVVRAVRTVLRLALDNQGTTFSTFQNPYGEEGRNADVLLVYGKGRIGVACTRCGSALSWTKLGGRGTTWCPRCQPLIEE